MDKKTLYGIGSLFLLASGIVGYFYLRKKNSTMSGSANNPWLSANYFVDKDVSPDQYISDMLPTNKLFRREKSSADLDSNKIQEYLKRAKDEEALLKTARDNYEKAIDEVEKHQNFIKMMRTSARAGVHLTPVDSNELYADENKELRKSLRKRWRNYNWLYKDLKSYYPGDKPKNKAKRKSMFDEYNNEWQSEWKKDWL